METGPFIEDLPIKMVVFYSYVSHYQRVSVPRKQASSRSLPFELPVVPGDPGGNPSHPACLESEEGRVQIFFLRAVSSEVDESYPHQVTGLVREKLREIIVFFSPSLVILLAQCWEKFFSSLTIFPHPTQTKKHNSLPHMLHVWKI